MTTSTAATAAQPYVAALRAADLFADRAYQRDLDTTRVDHMSDAFDRTLLGVLEVSARVDGRYAIIDGQHRWGVVRKVCGDEEHLVCQVHTGLTPGEEARLFLEIDTGRRGLTWWDRWRARRGQGDPNVLAIDEVLKRHGLQVNPAPADGNIRATKALETIVDDLGDLQMLDNVLIVLTSAFGLGFETFDGGIMQGVALVLGHYDADEVDTDRLIAQLRTIPPRQLRAKAVALREAHRGTVPRLCAAVIVERYNAGRGRGVEAFFTRVPSVSKAGVAFNRTRRERATIRRWAQRNGYDITDARSIPPSIRQAYENARVNADVADSAHESTAATGASTTGTPDDDSDRDTPHLGGEDDEHAGPDDHHRGHDSGPAEWDDFEDGSPEVGVPDRDGVLRALANGRSLRWVMDAYGLDYATAKSLHDQASDQSAA